MRREEEQQQRSWKRRVDEDWKDQGDPRGGQREEKDLRVKLQRNMEFRDQEGSGSRQFQNRGPYGWQGRYQEERWQEDSWKERRRLDPGARQQVISMDSDRGEGRNKKRVPETAEDEIEESNVKCFRCQEVGHHQKNCTNDPICYKCKKAGHMAAECGQGKLKMMGFAIPEQGFYCINIPTAKAQSTKAVAIIKLEEGQASEKDVEEELRNLIDKKWDWQVRMINEGEFVACFPDKTTLDTFSRLSGLVLGIHNLKVKIVKSDIDPEATSYLQTTWVKIYGIPLIARDVGIVNEIATLAGEPLVVDELSLIQSGPVRVKLNCLEPTKLRGFVRVFFNKSGAGSEICFRKLQGQRNATKTTSSKRP